MTFRYSICYPNTAEIEHMNDPISGSDVMTIAGNYPWLNQLNLIKTLDREDFYYNPSIEFICNDNGRSFTLTASFDESKQLVFSLWYKRPKTEKNLYGLSGTSEKMIVDDVWSIKFDAALKYLEYFVKGKYETMENLY